MTHETHIDAANRLLAVAREGRLTQRSWHSDTGGRHLMCLWGAMSTGRKIDSVEACPAHWAPRWLVEVSIGIFDGLAETELVPFAIRFGTAMSNPRWASVRWKMVRVEFLLAVMAQALEAARPACEKELYWTAVEEAHRLVRDALRGKGNLATARAAADAAAWDADAAAWDAGAAARAAAAWDADAAAGAAARVAVWAAQGPMLLDLIEAEMTKVTP